MVLKARFSSRRWRSSSHGRGVKRGGTFMDSLLAIADGHRAAGRSDGVLRELEIGDLLERNLLLGVEVADVDGILDGPFATRAVEAFVDREDAGLGHDAERVL